MKPRIFSLIGPIFAALLLGLSIAQADTAQWLDRPWRGSDGRIHISVARADALRDCNARAAQYPEYLFGNLASYQYRTCMQARGQVE